MTEHTIAKELREAAADRRMGDYTWLTELLTRAATALERQSVGEDYVLLPKTLNDMQVAYFDGACEMYLNAAGTVQEAANKAWANITAALTGSRDNG